MSIVFDRNSDIIQKISQKLDTVRQWIFVNNIGHVAGPEYGVSFIQNTEFVPYLYIEMVCPDQIHHIGSFLSTEFEFFLDSPENKFSSVEELKQLLQNQTEK
jgi:hypothetical protein